MNLEIKGLFKRNDIILIVLIVLTSIFLFVAMVIKQEDGGIVVLKVGGETYKDFPLLEDMTYTMEFEDGRYNTIVIKDGYVEISDASCPDQICVNHRKIQKSGETIVCLPNQLVIEIKGSSQSDLDAIVN
ncbi:MAG: NusG domain II-containing protein [Clostridiales bacterium]|nr:NusG domain II-containing protein [Clostridiales bacterium]